MSERNGIGTVSERNGIGTVTTRNTADVIRERNDHDAATVLAIVLALSAQDSAEPAEVPGQRSIWSDPAHRLRTPQPSATAWWASAMPR